MCVWTGLLDCDTWWISLVWGHDWWMYRDHGIMINVGRLALCWKCDWRVWGYLPWLDDLCWKRKSEYLCSYPSLELSVGLGRQPSCSSRGHALFVGWLDHFVLQSFMASLSWCATKRRPLVATRETGVCPKYHLHFPFPMYSSISLA